MELGGAVLDTVNSRAVNIKAWLAQTLYPKHMGCVNLLSCVFKRVLAWAAYIPACHILVLQVMMVGVRPWLGVVSKHIEWRPPRLVASFIMLSNLLPNANPMSLGPPALSPFYHIPARDHMTTRNIRWR
jgi:hypothetical protein